MTVSIDSSVLLSYMQAKSNLSLVGLSGSSTSGLSTSAQTAAAAAAAKIPTAPWDVSSTAPRSDDLVKSVMAGHAFVDVNAAQLDVKGASDDYKKLFALYQGLNALDGLAEQASAKGVGTTQLMGFQRTFASGVTQVSSFLDSLNLDQLRLTRGDNMTADTTAVGVPKDDATYQTGVIFTGSSTDLPSAFQGAVKFDMSIKRGSKTFDIPIDLSQMGSTPRTMSAVVSYMNSQLQAAGVVTRFAADHEYGQPRTIQAGSQTITLPAGPDQWSLDVKGDTSETLTFSAPATSGAVYLAQTAGKATVTTTTTNGVTSTTTDNSTIQQQLLKFQTDESQTTTPAAPAVAPPNSTYTVNGRVFAQGMGPEVVAVHATATGADGSVYVLADVTGTTDGQTIQGAQDAALMKYDSAGNLIYTRTLGAAGTATGAALAVSADGKVAIAGSVTGELAASDGTVSATTTDATAKATAATGADATKSDSFVTLFDAQGQELWTQRRAALADDEASAVAFGADGSVYVAGRAKSAMIGATAEGGWDGYVQGFSSAGKPQFATQFGTAGDDKATALAVDGSSLLVAGMDGADGVVRRFNLQATGAPTLAATRDLGSLQGGNIAGVGVDGDGNVIVAGSAGNPALNVATITSAHGAGTTTDAFVAKLSSGLVANSGDKLAYFGGSGTDTATALAVNNGEVWIAGSSNGDLPGMTKVGKDAADKDGYLVRFDVDSGTVEWGRRFSAQGGQAAPTSIAVDPEGSSVLDRLGLPTGTLTYTDSPLLTAATSVRAGDQFFISSSEGGRPAAVTITADDTLATLATKISRAANFQVKTTIVTDGDYKRLKIEPLSSRSTLEISAGKTGQSALVALGITEGVVQPATTDDDSSSAKTIKTYGLKLDLSKLNLNSPDSMKQAQSALLSAMTVIQGAYRDLQAAAQPKTTTNTSASGPVPAYLTAQIANYQAALDRLTGGS